LSSLCNVKWKAQEEEEEEEEEKRTFLSDVWTVKQNIPIKQGP